MRGYIDSIETMGLVDGPGIRMVVFLRGCKLRCSYCHNPETWNMENAITMSSDEIIERIHKNMNYYKNGGITFSGGEPLMQAEFLIECLRKCKEIGIHTALDTAGVGIDEYDEILDYTDLVILDIKGITNDEYSTITGQSMDEFNRFVHILNKREIPVWIRQVVIPGINDNQGYMLKLKEYLNKVKNISKVELLPYHLYGVEKYMKLGIPYRLEGVPALTEEQIDPLRKIFE